MKDGAEHHSRAFRRRAFWAVAVVLLFAGLGCSLSELAVDVAEVLPTATPLPPPSTPVLPATPVPSLISPAAMRRVLTRRRRSSIETSRGFRSTVPRSSCS